MDALKKRNPCLFYFITFISLGAVFRFPTLKKSLEKKKNEKLQVFCLSF